MKTCLSLLISCLCLASAGQTSFIQAPDYLGTISLDRMYSSYKLVLHDKIMDGSIALFSSPTLEQPLDKEGLNAFLESTAIVNLPTDDFFTDWIDSVIVFHLEASNWQALRFEKNCLAIQLTETKTGYIANKDLNLLPEMHTQILEKFQNLNNPLWISERTISDLGACLYDSVQAHIFRLIESNQITLFRADSITVQMPIDQFDTIFDEMIFLFPEDAVFGQDDQMTFIEFDATLIRGLGIRTQLSETPEGWKYEYTHIGLLHQPSMFDGNELFYMVWMDWKELKKLLSNEEWYLFQDIIRTSLLVGDMKVNQVGYF